MGYNNFWSVKSKEEAIKFTDITKSMHYYRVNTVHKLRV